MTSRDSGSWMERAIDAGPFRTLTAETVGATLSAHMVPDGSAASCAGRVLRPRNPLSLRSVLIESVNVADREGAADCLSDTGGPDELISLLAPTAAVVTCEVLSSMVSSTWGLGEFTLEGPGYLFETTDEDLTGEGIPLFGAWEPAEDAGARRGCVRAVWAREWQARGWPPYASIERLAGDLEVVLEGVVDAVRDDRSWLQGTLDGLDVFTEGELQHAAEFSMVPLECLSGLNREIGRGDGRIRQLQDSGGLDQTTIRGIVALYLQSLTG